jgi:large subunit ribosomal protein L10
VSITIDKKRSIVEELTDNLKGSKSVYLVNFGGIRVEKDNAFRKLLNSKKIPYQVAKNTLIKRALAEVGVKGLDSYLKGTTAVLFGGEEDPIMPAKELVDFCKLNPDVLSAKALNLDGEVIDGAQIGDVAKMPGRLQLIAMVVAMATGPGAKLVSIINGPGSTIAGQLEALVEKLEKN